MSKASEVMAELVADLRRHEDTARTLLAAVPTDADDSNVRSHVRLRAKAGTYAHAAELAADAALRLPEEPITGWSGIHASMQGLQVHLGRHHGLSNVSFSFGGIHDLYVHVGGSHAIELDVSEPLTSDKIDDAVRTWRTAEAPRG